jgi:hypothetical protein
MAAGDPHPDQYPGKMPGTETHDMSDGTHPDAVKQTYYLADGGGPVTQGEHVRQPTKEPQPAEAAVKPAGDGS